MSFRTRLALVAAAAVALAVVAASFAVYFVVKGQLYGSVDDSLRRSATLVQNVDPHEIPRFTSPQFRAIGGVTQVVGSNGATFPPSRILPVTDEVSEVAKGKRDESIFNTHALDQHLRVLAVQYPARGVAIEVARSLDDTDHALSQIKLFLFLIAGFGIAVAAGLGLVVSRAALAPVRRLTQTAEEVSETRDLSRRIDVHGRDELSRLASTFNTMLAALEDSARAQRQFVSDASHELRTPLTSLRTNIEVLSGETALPPEEREQLMRDVGEQLVEMSALVAELVELARDDDHPHEPEDVRLDLVAAEAIERTRRNRPGVTFNPSLDESLVRGVPATIERAVSNLLDNAAKWSPPGGEVDVAVHAGEVAVRDHGPGIAEEDVPFIFDRFYRAPSARSMPGSGLGLAIVRQVADAHGGTISVETPEGGGTRMRLRLPSANGSAVIPD
jgi:two-component system, OmpR family, sensor histidine kinase MprB